MDSAIKIMSIENLARESYNRGENIDAVILLLDNPELNDREKEYLEYYAKEYYKDYAKYADEIISAPPPAFEKHSVYSRAGQAFGWGVATAVFASLIYGVEYAASHFVWGNIVFFGIDSFLCTKLHKNAIDEAKIRFKQSRSNKRNLAIKQLNMYSPRQT